MSKNKKIILLLIVLLTVSAGLFVGNFVTDFKRDQPQMFADPVFDSTQPVFKLGEGRFTVLVFSKTNGFRHHDGIPAANELLATMAAEQQWAIAFTENGAAFNAIQLAQFDLVVWNNVTGPALTSDQQRDFEEYINSGGGYLGIHGAGDGSHKAWPWYVNKVLRSQFTMHPLWPQIQRATLNTENSKHPVIDGLPAQWSMVDEWYSFESSVRANDSLVLLTVDENTYDPNFWAMGADHPLVWSHSVGEGRVVYAAPGHTKAVYQDVRYQQLILNAIYWVGGGKP
ncbi:MAG: type 1 glutamine amidotransferase [Zhongshania sp.]|jgi:type 1 glutamine amidotransferase